MTTLAVIVLTRNEERHIQPCLESVRESADELLILDSQSTDRTVETARAMGARVETRSFDSFAGQRNAAIGLSRADWIFFVDADERGTVALLAEVKEQIQHAPPGVVGFWVPRRNITFGKEIRYAGWSTDYQPRILRRGCGHFDPARTVHELLTWDGQAGYLREHLIHYNYDNLAQFRKKQLEYTRFEARIWFEEGKHARKRGFLGQPVREFWRRYVSLEGWRDGRHGLLLCALMGYYAFVRQRLLWNMSKLA